MELQKKIMTDSMDEKIVFKNQKGLRRGITSGTCATAAAYAATYRLLAGEDIKTVTVHTPSLEDVMVNVLCDEDSTNDSQAMYYVYKDSGDDPDVTNGCKIAVLVSAITGKPKEECFESDGCYGIYITGGKGVGIVTKEGLEQRIGYPAINKVPRQMISNAVSDVIGKVIDEEEWQAQGNSLLVTVIVPDGEELAKKTFNPVLGIEGGISILGTSGILEPMSEKAIVDTIETLIKQASCLGKKYLCITPGHYGQGYVSDYVGLPLDNSIKCSNYIGDTLDLCVSYNIDSVLLVGNIGKLVKLAAGIMNTHSKTADGRMEVLCTHLSMCGGDCDQVRKLYDCTTTEFALELLTEWGYKDRVLESVVDAIDRHLDRRVKDELKVGIMLFSEKYGFLAKNRYADDIVKQLKENL